MLDPENRPLFSKWQIIIILASYLLLFLIVAARAHHRKIPSALFVSDGFGYYIYLPSVIIDGDLDLSNQLANQPAQPDQPWYRFVSETNRPGNCFQVGCAVLWSPFFLLAHGIVLALNAFGLNLRTDGFGWPYEMAVYCGSFSYGMLGLWYMWRLATGLWNEALAQIVVLYMALGTALAAYLWFEPDMSHVISMALISALFFYLYRIDHEASLDWKRWAGIGLLLGAIGSVRVPDLLVGLAGLLTGLSVWRKRPGESKQAIACILACAAGAFLAFLPQMIAWKALYGGFLSRPPGVYDRFNWWTPEVYDYLFSTKRGILLWTPLLGLSMVGLAIGVLKGSKWSRYGAVILAMALYFNSALPLWWAGCSFSERRMVDYSIIFALGIGNVLSLPSVMARKWLVQGAGALLCGFNWLLLVRYFSHDLPEYGYVSAHDLFVKTILFPFEIFSKFGL